VQKLGFTLDPDMVQHVFDDFIALADKKKEIYDSDIVALIENRIADAPARWRIVSVHTSAGTGTIPTATVKLERDDAMVQCDADVGDGPIDAVFHAMERITGIVAKLEDFQVRSVSSGKDAQGEVSVELSTNGRVYHGKGVSTDIIEASAQAYLKALNRAEADRRPKPQPATEPQTARGVR
jgi:2-isopropylmalate synthase